MTDTLKERLAQLPAKPGVYQYYNVQGDLLYVGKAKDLAKRVKSYWQKSSTSPWTQILVSQITDIKTIEVKSELEALLLENSLIKSLRPQYNIKLKDDKTFPFIRVSNEAFPTFTITRKVKNDKARYLGPYFSATYIRSMLRLLVELYGIKTSSEKSYEQRSSVPKQIGLGARNLENQQTYKNHVEQAVSFISRPQPQMEKIVKQAMLEASSNEQFERAAKLRDRLAALEQLRNDQSLFSGALQNRDYVGITQVGKLISVYVLFEREGKIVNHKDFLFEFSGSLNPEALSELVINYLYINGLAVPKEIVLSTLPNESTALETALSEQAGKKVRFYVPKRGELKKRLDTALENAEYQLKLQTLKKNRRETALADLATLVGLPKIPKRIEACDISNLGPTNIVGATIVFINGQPAKNEYRKYKIITPEGQDDFASMRELVFRRIHNKDRQQPDLLLIDGGKGQLSAGLDALKLAKVEVPIVSLAKKEELLYLPNKSEPIVLPHNSDALLLLMAIRDEVHRFVITFHRKRRSKSLFTK